MNEPVRPLAGRVAVVTGGGRGLGRAHALELARLGAAVVVNDIGSDPEGHGASAAPAQQVAQLIRDRGGSALAHGGSVGSADAVDELLGLALREFGHVDMLVNNAGFLRNGFLLELTEDDWDTVLDVHLKGTFLTTQRFGRYWREEAKQGRRRRPAVVNTTSAAGLQGNVQQANYVAAKAGVAMLTVTAAAELGRNGVRVNAVAPIARTRLTMGVPATAAFLGEEPAGADAWAPEHVSRVVAWLLSASCRFTGRIFAVHRDVVGVYRGWGLAAHTRGDGSWDFACLTEATAEFPDDYVISQTDLLDDGMRR